MILNGPKYVAPAVDPDQPAPTLEAWLAEHRDRLLSGLLAALRKTMFNNRHEMRPAHFGRIAAEEAAALLTLVARPEQAAATERGARLCREGLGEAAVLGMAQTVRQLLLNAAPQALQATAIDQFEHYHSAVMSGFIAARTTLTLEEQERIRSAIQRTVSRYALQMAVAADVARAATSILDLDELLQTAVELIRSRFGLYYVAIFLVDADQRWAYLQASSGEVGGIMLRRGHRLKVGGDSLVGWCIDRGEARIALDVGEKAISFDTPVLTDIHSEMVIPLISRGRVIGAMAVQSRNVGAFSEQDSAVMRITADQLANAITNARLFRERERQISELSVLNELSRSIAAALDLDTLLQTVHQQVGRIYEASQVTIAICNTETHTWRLVYDYRDGAPQPLTGAQHEGGLLGYLAASGEALLLGNVRTKELFGRRGIAEPLGAEVLSWMGAPLIAANAVVGVVTVASTAQEDRYTDRDLAFLTTMASQVAIALVNTRLYEQLRQELRDRELTAHELREAKEAAEEASRAKSTFLANMSHELRTPLTGIIGYSELLQREVQHRGYVELISDLAKIHTAGSHLLSIINDILDLSKIESGKMQLFLETFDLAALLDEVQVTASPLIKKNQNRLVLESHGPLGLVCSDVTKIRQIVLNLLSNAAKFTSAGLITLTAARSTRADGEWIVISISDTGIGIEREQIGRLFQDFTQADASMTRRYGGTGLGLALSRRLCHMLGGIIEVISEPGRGSTFTVRFPAVAEEQPRTPARPTTR